MREISDPTPPLLLGSCQPTLSPRKMAPDKQCRYQRVIGVGGVSQRRPPRGNHFEITLSLKVATIADLFSGCQAA